MRGTCVPKNCNFSNPGGKESAIRFLTYDEKCVQFYLNNGQIMKKESSNESSDNFGSVQAFTSNDLTIKDLDFKLSGECQGESKQPTGTILIKAETGNNSFEIQTTITQRNLDVPR